MEETYSMRRRFVKKNTWKKMSRGMQRKGFLCFFAAFILLLAAAVSFVFQVINTESGKKAFVKHRLQWWLSAINWDGQRTKESGEGVRIAILDSGVDKNHPDISRQIEQEYRVSGLGIKKKNQDGKEENNVHGTAVAGIIAGFPSSEKGILGVAHNARIISVDVTDDPNGIIKVEHLVEGIEYAISQKAEIINISAGVKQPSDELYKAVQKAYDAGIVIVAAAGNYMRNDLLYPAKYKEVIAAGALSREKSILSPKGDVGKNIIYLPGENIATAGSNQGYTAISGTSAATPILTGIVALMKERNNTLTNDKIIRYFNSYHSTEIDVRKCMELKYQ